MTFDELPEEEQQSLLSMWDNDNRDIAGIKERINNILARPANMVPLKDHIYLTYGNDERKMARRYLHMFRERNRGLCSYCGGQMADRGLCSDYVERTEVIEAYLEELNRYPEQERNAGIIAMLDEKYQLTIGRLPGREDFLRETVKLYSEHSWFRVSRVFLKKYGMNLDEMIKYYHAYPYSGSMSNADFAYVCHTELSSTRKTRMHNIKTPALLTAITEIENYSRLDEILKDDAVEDFFCNYDYFIDAVFLELFLKVKDYRWA